MAATSKANERMVELMLYRNRPIYMATHRGVRAAMVTLLLLVGCGTDEDSLSDEVPADRSGELEGNGVRTWTLGQEADVTPAVNVSGELTLAGECLALRLGGEGGPVYIVVWPHGTDLLEGDFKGVSVPEVGDVIIGDSIQASGGFEDVDRSNTINVPAQCLSETSGNELAIIYTPSTIEVS